MTAAVNEVKKYSDVVVDCDGVFSPLVTKQEKADHIGVAHTGTINGTGCPPSTSSVYTDLCGGVAQIEV